MPWSATQARVGGLRAEPKDILKHVRYY